MAKRNTVFTIGEFYHLYNRGNSKQIIFHDTEDMDRFLQLLCISNREKHFVLKMVDSNVYKEKETPIVSIGSYCLMPNHFHILATPLVDKGISIFMQKLLTAYAMFYNKKYKHSGGLFEGKFKSSYIDNDNYLKYIFSYIHLNPVKLIDPEWKKFGLKNVRATRTYLRTYKYSSYIDFLNNEIKRNEREESSIVDLSQFPKYFPNGSLFEREIIGWLSLKPFNLK